MGCLLPVLFGMLHPSDPVGGSYFEGDRQSNALARPAAAQLCRLPYECILLQANQPSGCQEDVSTRFF